MFPSFRPAALLSLALLGCTGESVERADAGTALNDAVTDTTSTDTASTDTASGDSAADAACSTIPGNRVQNPSFELASMGAPTGWSMDTGNTATQRKGAAAHCEAWAELKLRAASSSFPTWFGQEIPFDPPPVKGSHITATAMLRTLDADLSGFLRVSVTSGSYLSKPVVLQADGTWKQYSIEWTIPDDVIPSLGFDFTSESSAARTVGIDHVTFVVTPP